MSSCHSCFFVLFVCLILFFVEAFSVCKRYQSSLRELWLLYILIGVLAVWLAASSLNQSHSVKISRTEKKKSRQDANVIHSSVKLIDPLLLHFFHFCQLCRTENSVLANLTQACYRSKLKYIDVEICIFISKQSTKSWWNLKAAQFCLQRVCFLPSVCLCACFMFKSFRRTG